MSGCEMRDFIPAKLNIQELETVNDYEDQEIDLPSPEPHIGTYGGDC